MEQVKEKVESSTSEPEKGFGFWWYFSVPYTLVFEAVWLALPSARWLDAIRAELPDDVEVLTRAQYIQREIDYWDSATPIGYVFGFGVIVGLVVGGIIVYQILFADVNDHLPEYATLKAMGYSNGFLAGIVIQQAVILAAFGFIPAMGLSVVLYRISGDATRLPLEMTQERAVFVFGLTVAMCVLSALMALRKVRSADPAEIF